MLKKTLLAALTASVLCAPAFAAQKEAIFAGGCFWCIEKDFEHVEGVIDVASGYTGGTNENPTYKNHTSHGHREVVKIVFDDAVVGYDELLHTFFRTVNPTDGGGQFCDRGHSYSTAVYAYDDEQLAAAKAAAQQAAQDLGKPIATELTTVHPFTPAEEYHQDYYKKNPLRYSFYRKSCGRDRNVKKLWGKAAYPNVAGKSS